MSEGGCLLALRLIFDTNAVHWSVYTLFLPESESLRWFSWMLSVFPMLALTSFSSVTSARFCAWSLCFSYSFFRVWDIGFCLFAGDCSSVNSGPPFRFSRTLFLMLVSFWSVDAANAFDSCWILYNCSSSRRGETCERAKAKDLYQEEDLMLYKIKQVQGSLPFLYSSEQFILDY